MTHASEDRSSGPRTFRDTGESLRSHAADTVRSAADEGKAQIAATLDGLVMAVREFADRLGPDDSSPVARYTRQAADTLGDWTAAVNDKSVDELLDESREVVRKSPALALGVAVAAGFALSRFLKATAPAPRPTNAYKTPRLDG